MKYLLHLLLFLPLLATAQSGDMRVYTVAGSYPALSGLGDGGPATAAALGSTEGIWLDGNCNLYISDIVSRIRKVEAATGIISTVAGTGIRGFSGDGGIATNAKITTYGLYVTYAGDILIPDAGNNRIRKVDALTGIITTIAGGGAVLGDGGIATNAQLFEPANVYQDFSGNIYIGERSRIRRIDNTTGVINTIAGTGSTGFSGDGGLATKAQLFGAQGMLLDGMGNLLFADRGNHRIRKIDLSTNIITTVVGSTDGYSGDGGLATNAQLSGPISFVIDRYNNLIVGDNQNNYLRKVDAATGIITTIAGMGPSGGGASVEGAPATAALVHPEFMYLDLLGNIYFSNYSVKVRKITNWYGGLPASGSRCGSTEIAELDKNELVVRLYPNPVYGDKLTISVPADYLGYVSIYDYLGRLSGKQEINRKNTVIDVSLLQSGLYIVQFNGNYSVSNKYFHKL